MTAGINPGAEGVDVGDGCGCGGVSGDCAGVVVILQLAKLSVASENATNKHKHLLVIIVQLELAVMRTKYMCFDYYCQIFMSVRRWGLG